MPAKRKRKGFPLGFCVITPDCYDLLFKHKKEPEEYFKRHVQHDWGDASEETKALNDYAVDHDERIFSVYKLGKDEIYIITNADRCNSTMLLASEY